MAAGIGSRFKSGVKQLQRVGPAGESIMDYSIYDALEAGFNRIVFIIRKDIESDFRTRLFDRIAKNFDAEYVFQSHDSLLTEEQIKQVCKTVGIDHFIKTLPGGLDAEVTEGESISSGQKQLLTIARGMVEDAPFLILDEATSNVDTRTEELVQKAMDKLTEGKTSFIIAHRLSTIKNADLILVMKEGNIIEQGNHEELLKKNGCYAELYNSQFKK